jgi:hypothetical protein
MSHSKTPTKTKLILRHGYLRRAHIRVPSEPPGSRMRYGIAAGLREIDMKRGHDLGAFADGCSHQLDRA